MVLLVAVAASATPAGTSVDHTGLPLQPTRHIRFTTDEGTWLSLDVAPDGREIVFDLLGDLYIIPIGGGAARRITNGPAFDAQPRFSPDGGEIVFTSDRNGWVNVWIAARDGTRPRQLSHFAGRDGGVPIIASPEWVPDGTAIVATERLAGFYGGERLVEYPISGGPARPLTHIGSPAPTPQYPSLTRDDIKDRIQYRGAAFGRDPRFVYAAAKSNDLLSEVWQVAKIDRLRGTSVLETSPILGVSAERPALSPDGRFLVFGSPSGEGTGLRIRDLTTDHETWLARRAQRRIADTIQGTMESRDLLPSSSFTPDGKAFVTAFDGKIWSIDVQTRQSKQIPFIAQIDQQVGPLIRFEYPITDEPFQVRAIRTPRISPDGTRVAFTALDRVWIMAIRTRPSSSPEPAASPGQDLEAMELGEHTVLQPRRLTTMTTGEFFPTWSPDGRYLTYATWSDLEGGALFRMRADGSGSPERLTVEPGLYTKPVHSPDGTSIIAVRAWADDFRAASPQHTRADGAGMQLVRLPASGGPARVIAAYGPSDPAAPYSKAWAFVYGQPQVLRDAALRVAFYDPAEGLISLGANGADRRLLVAGITAHSSDGGNAKAKEVLVSPTGRAALAIAPTTDRPFLVMLPTNESQRSISLPAMERNTPGSGALPLSSMGVDFVGWTDDERPYFSVGNLLFIADEPISTAPVKAPNFRRIEIPLRNDRDRPAGTLLLRGAKILTMHDREVIEKGDVLIHDGRIAAVGSSGSLEVPAGATVFDVGGATVLPGYVDVHDHIGADVSYGVHLTQEPRFLVDLAHGVTALRDPVGYGPDLMAHGERASAGDVVAPRIFTMTTGTYAASFGDGSQQTIEDTRAVLQRWSEAYHSETIKQYLAGGRRTRQLIAMAALEMGLTPTNEGGQDTAMQLTMALDGYGAVEHRFKATPIFADVVQLFARTGIIQTPTFGIELRYQTFLRQEDILADAKLRRFYPPDSLQKLVGRMVNRQDGAWNDEASVREITSAAAKIMAAGGCIGVGSHGNIPGLGTHFELWYLAKSGMPLYDVLRAGTICGAESIGHARDFGSIAPGKLADLQVLDRNPLEDIRHTRAIRYVMKGGRLFDAATLDEIWPRRRALPRQWWWPGKASQ